MKKYLGLVVILLAALAGWFFYSHAPKGEVDMLKYRVVFEQRAFVNTTDESLNLVAYQAVDEKVRPYSFLAVYRVVPDGEKLVYRYAPVVPDKVGYPRPLVLEEVQLAQQKLRNLMIVTSWGETGADYWGTHPIVINYLFGLFRATDTYTASLTKKSTDFEVSNYFDQTERVKTFLTQGINVNRKKELELKFIDDDLPKAAKHKLVTLKIKILK